MPAGRPTKYTPELLQQAGEYLRNYEEHDHAFPSDVGLADVLEISTTTLYDWAKHKDKAEFSDILDQINRKQQLVAWNKGLKGDYNASLVKLLLGKHGFSDRQELGVNVTKSLSEMDEDELDRMMAEKHRQAMQADED